MKIKEHDFVEIEYTGKVSDGEIVFDTTDEEIAKKSNIHNENMKYGPVIICVGEGHILAGIDKNLKDKEVGKDYEFKLSAEDGFGKKSAKLLKLVPASVFKKQQVRPMPGLQVNIDGVVGTVRTATGGRVIVDFNHPLSGKELEYKVKIDRIVSDKAEQVKSLIKMLLNAESNVVVNEGKATVEMEQELPENFKKELESKIVDLVKIKEVIFKVPKPEKH